MCFVCAARDQGLSLTIDNDGLLAVERIGFVADAVGSVVSEATNFSLTGVTGSASITAEARTEAASGTIVEGLTVFQMGESDQAELTPDSAETWIIGREVDDYITVVGVKNLIDAGAGNDRISVQALNTTVIGGSGADVIELGFVPILWGAADRVASASVLDLNLSEGDRLDLSGLALAFETPDAALRFVGTADFSGVAGEVRYAVTGYLTQVFADLDGDGFGDFRVDLVGSRSLTATDLGLTAPAA